MLKIEFITILNLEMPLTDECTLYDSDSESELECAENNIINNGGNIIKRVSITSGIFFVMFWSASANANLSWILFISYFISISMIIRNTLDRLDPLNAYLYDFIIMLCFTFVIRLDWFKYLSILAIVRMMYKHMAMMLDGIKNIPYMNSRGWILLSVSAFPFIVKLVL